MELIVNENALLPEYLPKRLPGREREIEDIAYNFRLALNGRKPENLLIHGPPGTGKTAVLKYVICELEKYSNKVKIVYINCWHAGTRHNVVSEVARKVGFISPMKGISVEDILKRMADIVMKKKYFVVVVLDEMDRLIAGGHGDVLYDISRMNEAYRIKVSVVGIVNNFELVAGLDSRIRSSAINRDVEFRPYTVPMLKKILEGRAALALGKYDDEAVGLCAAYAYKMNGDARRGIGLLLTAARIAERKGKGGLDAECVEEAAKQAGAYGKESRAEVKLGEIERRIINCIRELGEVKSGELYKIMNDVNDRTLRNYINRLAESGIIEIKKENARGKSRTFRMKKGKHHCHHQ